MPRPRTRTPTELLEAIREIRVEADSFLARKAATKETWAKFKAELEDRDAAMRIILEAAARERAALAMLDPADRELAIRAILYPKPKHS